MTQFPYHAQIATDEEATQTVSPLKIAQKIYDLRPHGAVELRDWSCAG
jgi:hypothetical protein